MSKKISQDQIQQLRDKFSSDNHVKVVRNAMIKTNSNELSMDWEKYRKIDHSFSHVVSGEMPATNQKSSGRCWGFAGLNLFRVYLGRKHNLKDFQFSQSYWTWNTPTYIIQSSQPMSMSRGMMLAPEQVLYLDSQLL